MSQECQQPQAHPARCGCEQKKPHPDRLCHIDYAAHPYHCGCLKGDAEAQRRFDEYQRNTSVLPAGYCDPNRAQQGGEPKPPALTVPPGGGERKTFADAIKNPPDWVGKALSGGKVVCAICADLGDQCVTCEEAEFSAWADRHFASADYRQTSAGVFIQDWMRHSFAAWQARGKDVTRLQAENAALQQRLNVADQLVDDLQSELTKARELLTDLKYWAPSKGQVLIDRFLAHQSAPACMHEWDINEQGTATTCSSCGARSSDDAPVAKGGE
ncbi:hypothetical protein [Pseudomonas abietaniphila]|uniref:Uncharacterized protein n=1 Tax=Pseudomonas abietaniphila TaxID=89065 RepID=A0A1G8TFW0_9PSED|nr:hypothetical protein [Pseudomonas abietaniphila]SDJ40472.1 hypothetical protein SAMN05216605_12869 [Pseudomonas abietaniphila]